MCLCHLFYFWSIVLSCYVWKMTFLLFLCFSFVFFSKNIWTFWAAKLHKLLTQKICLEYNCIFFLLHCHFCLCLKCEQKFPLQQEKLLFFWINLMQRVSCLKYTSMQLMTLVVKKFLKRTDIDKTQINQNLNPITKVTAVIKKYKSFQKVIVTWYALLCAAFI